MNVWLENGIATKTFGNEKQRLNGNRKEDTTDGKWFHSEYFWRTK